MNTWPQWCAAALIAAFLADDIFGIVERYRDRLGRVCAAISRSMFYLVLYWLLYVGGFWSER
jgi:hypothetical protein